MGTSGHRRCPHPKVPAPNANGRLREDVDLEDETELRRFVRKVPRPEGTKSS
jgi:hypothetical protein